MFKITIEETKIVQKNTGGKWGVIGEKEVARDDCFIGGYGEPNDEPKTRIEKIHGYTPELIKDVEQTEKVFEQVVDDIDLMTVIVAVNSNSDSLTKETP